MSWKAIQEQCPKCKIWSEVYLNTGDCPFCEMKRKGPTVLDILVAIGLVAVLVIVWFGMG